MKLRKVKAPATDYVVTIRNGEPVVDAEARPEQNAAAPKAGETDAEALERMGLAVRLPGPDPGSD